MFFAYSLSYLNDVVRSLFIDSQSRVLKATDGVCNLKIISSHKDYLIKDKNVSVFFLCEYMLFVCICFQTIYYINLTNISWISPAFKENYVLLIVHKSKNQHSEFTILKMFERLPNLAPRWTPTFSNL